MGRHTAVKYEPPRYPKQPWMLDEADLRRQGDDKEVLSDAGDIERHDGWRIVSPRGNGDEMLMVRAVRGNGNDGGEISLSISPYWPVKDPPRHIDPQLFIGQPHTETD